MFKEYGPNRTPCRKDRPHGTENNTPRITGRDYKGEKQQRLEPGSHAGNYPSPIANARPQISASKDGESRTIGSAPHTESQIQCSSPVIEYRFRDSLLPQMDTVKIQSAARKALIAADSDYYSWPSRQQEKYRATMDEAAQNRVDAVLLNDLLDIPCTAATAEEIWRDLPLAKLDNLNRAKLLTTGIGDDMIFLNESMAENTSLLDFNTLYDYDYDDYQFQKQANRKEFRDYPGRDYYALRFSRWARLIIDDRFYYATLYSLAGYLIEHIENKGHDIIQTLIPHEYVDGKDHGRPEKGGYLWDMQIDGAGLEKQLEELQSRWHQYTQQRWLELSQAFTEVDPAVYMEDIKQNGERHRNFIFNNATALKQIRWRHFLVDCKVIKADYAEIAGMEQQELAKAESRLRQAHADIMENFDPDVIKLRKRERSSWRREHLTTWRMKTTVDLSNGKVKHAKENKHENTDNSQ